MVVRAHIQIEHELRAFIRARAPAPDYFTERDFEYGRTVRLALLLGPSPELESALKLLGGLRNRFAHDPDTELSAKEASDFHNGLSDVVRTRSA